MFGCLEGWPRGEQGPFSSLVFVFLYSSQVVGSVLFLYWLISDGWNQRSPVTSGLFFAAEIIAFISSTLFLSCGLFVLCKTKRYPTPEDPTSTESSSDTDDPVHDLEESEPLGEYPTVAVCVCRYQEPIDDLIKTVECMDQVDWPTKKLQLYILDDGWYASEEEQQLIQLNRLDHLLMKEGDQQFVPRGEDLPPFASTSKLGRADCATECNYLNLRESSEEKPSITLIARRKPSESHFKAGNLNNLLYNYLPEAARLGHGAPEYLLILDHDMLPHEDIMSEAVQQLQRDRKLGFVQYPQRFSDLLGSDLLYAGNEIFFDGVQVNRGHVGMASFAGTNAVWRLQSLYQVGGLQYGSLTEDTLTGMAAHMAGYTSAYSQKEMAVGQSPQTVENAMQQRMRWSQGAVEIALKVLSDCFMCRSSLEDIPVPEELAQVYKTDGTAPPSSFQWFLIFVIYLDSSIYPLYSIGYLLHILVCALYLINTEAPIAPSEPLAILTYWLPLYAVKTLCQLWAFPRVSLSSQWNSQMAWAGYSFSTLASIFKAFQAKWNKNIGTWFNTGAKIKKRFLLQYNNTVIALGLYAMILYRAFAFVFKDDSCKAWMSVGALLYGFVMLLHVKGWALEPFRRHKNARKVDGVRPALKRRRSSHLEALDKAHSHKRAHHTCNLSLLFIVGNVAVFSIFLFFWGKNDCDGEVVDVISPPLEKIPLPSLPQDASFTTEFTAKGGRLLLNEEPFQVKGANWFGFETTRNVAFGINTRPQDAILKQLVQEGINALRIPVAVDSVLNPTQYVPDEWAIEVELNPHLRVGSYLDLLEDFIDRAASWGVVVLLDMHRLRNDEPKIRWPLDGSTSFLDIDMAWSALTDRFCDSWSVMGADLINEPTGVTWGDGGPSDWRIFAEQLADTVSWGCPKWLIFVEGGDSVDEEVSPLTLTDFGPFGSVLTNAGSSPVRIANPEKLVYSPHLYGPGTIGESIVWVPFADESEQLCFSCKLDPWTLTDLCPPEEFNGGLSTLRNASSELCKSILPRPDNPFPQNMPALWDFLFGFLRERNETIIIGEWGGTYVNPTFKDHNITVAGSLNPVDLTRELETAWNEAFVSYLADNGHGSFFWSINPESDDTAGLFLDDWKSFDTAKLELLRRIPSTNPLSILDRGFRGDGLESCLREIGLEMLLENDGGLRYEAESATYNRAFDSVGDTPRAIVFPQTEDQVRDVVLCAQEAHIGVCPRAGGLSFTADSMCEGILLDVRHLRQLERMDEETFWVGMGHKTGQLVTALASDEYQRLLPTGGHGGVGSGSLLGCGYGFLSRSLGLGCDNIVAARIVVASGEILEVRDDNEHAELMWALRGAGAGQFGVVTSLLLETYPLSSTPDYNYFRMIWPRSLASQAVSVWQEWALGASNTNFTCRLELWSPPAEEEEDFPSVQFTGVLHGSPAELVDLLQVPIGELGPPVDETRESFEYMPLLAHMYGIENNDVLQVRNPSVGYSGARRSFYNKGHLIPTRLDSEGIETLVRYVNEVLPGAQPYQAFFSMTPLGGAVANPSRPSTFARRDSLAVSEYAGFWTSLDQKYSVIRHQRQFHAAMQTFWGNSAFYNYKDNFLEDWEEAYWGAEAVPRLSNVKCEYDGLGIFSTAVQSITPNSTCTTADSSLTISSRT